MINFECKPNAPLDRFVDKIWYLKADVFDSHGITFPILQHELIFNFCGEFSLKKYRDETFVNPGCWLSGLQTRPVRSKTGGSHESLGVFFKPWGLRPFVNMPVSEFTDQQVDAVLIFGNKFRELAERVFEARTAEAKTEMVEEFLLNRLVGRYLPDDIPGFMEFLRDCEFEKGLVRVLAERQGMSSKSLIQKIKTTTGLPPGKFVHLIRFNKILASISSDPGRELTRTAHDDLFFDQPHFNHFFKSYAGMTPGQYRRCVRSGLVNTPFPNYLNADV